MLLFLKFLAIIVITSALECFENYAIVIDAGSTGSRAFVFRIIIDKNGKKTVTSTKVGKIHPGLSSFVSHPNDAVNYISPLLVDATALIPKSCYKATKVFIKGTAGMRLLTEEEQETIWTSLANGLHKSKSIPFTINRKSFGTINGNLEAFYAVLSSNHIAGTIDGDLK
jgi:Golgi nucleoside diphosphatase